MKFDSQRHHRRSIRLKGYDYSQVGAYFVTVCAQDRACLFGEIAGGQMHLNEAGRMVFTEWNALPARFPVVGLDEFCVMPNHIHGIITIAVRDLNTNPAGGVGAGLVPALFVPATEASVVAAEGATTRVAPTRAVIMESTPPRLGDIVGAFKSLTTDLYIAGVRQSGWPTFRGRLWQRNYHEPAGETEKQHRMTSFIESHAEDAALAWLNALGYFHPYDSGNGGAEVGNRRGEPGSDRTSEGSCSGSWVALPA